MYTCSLSFHSCLTRPQGRWIYLFVYLFMCVMPEIELGALHSPRSYIPSPIFNFETFTTKLPGLAWNLGPYCFRTTGAGATTPSPSCNYRCFMGTPCASSGKLLREHRVGPPAPTQRPIWGRPTVVGVSAVCLPLCPATPQKSSSSSAKERSTALGVFSKRAARFCCCPFFTQWPYIRKA